MTVFSLRGSGEDYDRDLDKNEFYCMCIMANCETKECLLTFISKYFIANYCCKIQN